MDTDGILSRKPQLVLVDELAHTNVPGSSRQKRYQDVEVILNHGINVYSTVNIQHLESLNDIIAKITKVVVRERIPDRILDEATQVVVIDVTPETLQERLKEGKIYTPDKIEKSLQNFFQRRHLVALRELALREVANNIEESAESREKTLFCNVHERVLVCFSTYHNSPRLVRRGLRLANFMKARLYGLYVENPERFLTKEESLVLETCQELIQEFGGEFIRIKTHNVAEGISEISQQYHITQIVIGHTRKSRWELILKGSLIHQLLKYLKGVDIHIIDGEKT
jgi:two-component system sensor histidine kinase KdpD